MKKLLLLLFLIPLICSAQQSRNVNIDVVDESGLKIGTMSMRATYTRTYGNGYEVAIEKYIQYLKEKESKEIAEKQRNALNQRLKSLGMSPVPSWDTGIYSAAMEGYASVKERAERNKKKAETKAKLARARNKKKAKTKAFPSKIEMEKIESKVKRQMLPIYMQQMQTLFKEGKYKESLSKANELISYEPSAINYEWRGRIKSFLYDNEGSIADYSKAIEINPEMPVSYLNRGILRYNPSDLEGSIVDFNKSIELKKTYEAYLWRGRIWLELGEYYKAIPDFMAALELNPVPFAKVDILLGLSRTKEKLNDIEGAKDGYNQILKYESQQPQALDALLGIKYKPRFDAIYDNEGRSEKYIKLRIEYLNERIKIFPEWIQGYRELVECNIKLGYFEEAIKHSIILIDLSATQGKDLTALDYNQIASLYREKKELYKAVSFYNKALEIDPLYPTAIGGLGTTKLYLGDVNGACDDWNKAVNLEEISQKSKQHYSDLISKNCN